MLMFVQKRDTLVVQENYEIHLETLSIVAFLNRLLLPHFRTLISFEKTMKSHFRWANMIPVWVDSKTLLFPIFSRRAVDSLYVNFHAVQSIRNTPGGGGIVTFINGSEMLVGCRRILLKQMERCRHLRDWMEANKQ